MTDEEEEILIKEISVFCGQHMLKAFLMGFGISTCGHALICFFIWYFKWETLMIAYNKYLHDTENRWTEMLFDRNVENQKKKRLVLDNGKDDLKKRY